MNNSEDEIFSQLNQTSNDVSLSLSHNQKLLEKVLKNMPGGFLLIGDNYRIYMVNEQVCQLTGFTREELIGELCDIVCPKGSASKECPIWAKNQMGFQDMHTAIKCKNGYKNPILKNAERINFYGKTYILESYLDIREINETNNRLILSEKRYHGVFENIGNCALIVDSNLTIKEVNGVCERNLGIKREMMIGKKLRDIFTYVDEKRIREKILNHVPDSVESHLCHDVLIQKDGRKHFFSVTAGNLSLEENVLAFHDITALKTNILLKDVLISISEALSSYVDIPAFLAFTRGQLGKLFNTENFYVCTHMKEKDELYFVYHADEKVTLQFFPAKNTLAGYVIKTQKPLCVNEDEIAVMIENGDVGPADKGTATKQWMGAPLIFEGTVEGVVAVQSYTKTRCYSKEDFTNLLLACDTVKTAVHILLTNEKLKGELTTKTALIQELHHRTNNNLQLIASLVKMYSRNAEIGSSGYLENLRHNVYAMSLVYKSINPEKSLSHISFRKFMMSLFSTIRRNFLSMQSLRYVLEIEDFDIIIDILSPLSIAINEIAYNLLGEIATSKLSGNLVFISMVQDTQIAIHLGFESNKPIPDSFCSATCGERLFLTNLLIIGQLKGSLDKSNTNGVCWDMTIPLTTYQPRV